MATRPVRLAVIVGPKGRGSNMLAIARACAEGRVPATVAVVIAPPGSPAIEKAEAEGLCVAVADPASSSYAEEMAAALESHGCELVCLAGYTRLLPKEVLHAFPGRVLNIHPALLPKYGGKGMYGMRVHEAVLAAGDKESGCTVHLVSEAYDEGAVILQRRVPVLPGDTPESLAARVLEQEHVAYPEAINKVLRGGA